MEKRYLIIGLIAISLFNASRPVEAADRTARSADYTKAERTTTAGFNRDPVQGPLRPITMFSLREGGMVDRMHYRNNSIQLQPHAWNADDSNPDLLRIEARDDIGYAVAMSAHSLHLLNMSPDGKLAREGTDIDFAATMTDIAIDQSGYHLLAASHTGIRVFGISPTSPHMTELGRRSVRGRIIGMARSESDRLLYVTTTGPDRLYGFTMDLRSGSLNPVKGMPIALPVPVKDIIVDRDSEYVYAIDRGQNAVLAYRIQGDGRLLAIEGSPFPLQGQGPTDIEISADNRYLLIANRDSLNVEIFRRDPNYGKLTPNDYAISLNDQPVTLQAEAVSGSVYVGGAHGLLERINYLAEIDRWQSVPQFERQLDRRIRDIEIVYDDALIEHAPGQVLGLNDRCGLTSYSVVSEQTGGLEAVTSTADHDQAVECDLIKSPSGREVYRVARVLGEAETRIDKWRNPASGLVSYQPLAETVIDAQITLSGFDAAGRLAYGRMVHSNVALRMRLPELNAPQTSVRVDAVSPGGGLAASYSGCEVTLMRVDASDVLTPVDTIELERCKAIRGLRWDPLGNNIYVMQMSAGSFYRDGTRYTEPAAIVTVLTIDALDDAMAPISSAYLGDEDFLRWVNLEVRQLDRSDSIWGQRIALFAVTQAPAQISVTLHAIVMGNFGWITADIHGKSLDIDMEESDYCQGFDCGYTVQDPEYYSGSYFDNDHRLLVDRSGRFLWSRNNAGRLISFDIRPLADSANHFEMLAEQQLDAAELKDMASVLRTD